MLARLNQMTPCKGIHMDKFYVAIVVERGQPDQSKKCVDKIPTHEM